MLHSGTTDKVYTWQKQIFVSAERFFYLIISADPFKKHAKYVVPSDYN